MRNIAAVVCGFLLIVSFQTSFGGSSAGHRVRIVVRHPSNQMEKNTGSVNQTKSDLFNDPFRIDGERYSASLGLEGNNRHFRWTQKKSDQGRYCVTMNTLDEIENALPILSGNAVHSKHLQFNHSILDSEKRPLVYCTVTDVQ
jgi:hypothetical protein